MTDDQSYQISRILEEMRSDYWRNLETIEENVVAEGAEFLIVQLAGRRYGLPATSCREVLKLPRILRVPRLPSHLPGIFNLRGEILAVTDLRPLLGLATEAAAERARLVVVEVAAMKTALLVDSVERLVYVEQAEVEPLAEGADAEARAMIAGKVVQAGSMILLFDLQRIMARPDLVVDQKQRDVAMSS